MLPLKFELKLETASYIWDTWTLSIVVQIWDMELVRESYDS